MKKENISVYLPKDLREWVDSEAKKENRLRSNQIVQLLNEARATRERVKK